jgi:hypothetical protein
MSIYFNKQLPGQLWLRDLKNNISPSYDTLSSIFIKYQTISNTFYYDVSSNNINRFDVINDTLFVETSSGYIFEKFYIDEYSGIQPYNQMNLFNTRKNTTVDYWYNESQKSIYFTEIFYTTQPILANTFTFNIIFKKFDCSTGLASVILLEDISIKYLSATNWDSTKFLLENPKLTYNPDTKTFNVSFILRNSVGSFGLISLNISDFSVPQISEVNGFLPFFTLDNANSYISG